MGRGEWVGSWGGGFMRESVIRVLAPRLQRKGLRLINKRYKKENTVVCNRLANFSFHFRICCVFFPRMLLSITTHRAFQVSEIKLSRYPQLQPNFLKVLPPHAMALNRSTTQAMPWYFPDFPDSFLISFIILVGETECKSKVSFPRNS